MRIASGEFDRKITIQQESVVRDAATGQEIVTWTTLFQAWASKRDVTAREFFTANQDVSERTSVFRFHYRDGVTPKMRVLCDGEQYDISGVAEMGNRAITEVTAIRSPAKDG